MNIEETKYKLQSTLMPIIWNKEKDGSFKLNPKIRLKLLRIAKQFYEDLGIKANLKDVILTGSGAGYNYNTQSDIDLHLIIDFNDINSNLELVQDWLLNKGGRWNEKHNIELKEHPVEIYVQNAKDENITGGMYSIFYDKWIQIPNSEEEIEYDENKVNEISNSLSEKINEFQQFLETHRSNKQAEKLYDAAKEFKKNIRTYRKNSLANNGLYSIGNLVFKQLRNTGYLEKLADIINKSYDLMFLEENRENIQEQNFMFSNEIEVPITKDDYNKERKPFSFEVSEKNYILEGRRLFGLNH